MLAMAILAILGIVVLPVLGLFLYEPSPRRGLDFSEAGETLRLSDGRNLAYLETGASAGRAVFYFHGGPGSRLEAYLFEELNQQLGVRMIAIDRPGYGRSDVQEDRTYLDWPRDVTELADHLGLSRFAVLGWSSGGPHALAVAHGIPERLAVAATVAGEAPYASYDLPQAVLTGNTFSGSVLNKLFMWSVRNGAWLMRAFLRLTRLMAFWDLVGVMTGSGDAKMSAKDTEFFKRRDYTTAQVEAFRQGIEGVARDFTLERIDWPFELEKVPGEVLVFHGADDGGVDPAVAEYLCGRIPSCEVATIYPGEGHSVVYHRYGEIIQAMMRAWE